jgi:hypothetical protein
MSVKEFSLKTLVFIGLPGLAFYGVRSCQNRGNQQLVTFQRCVWRLQQTPPLALTIYGEHEVKRVTSPTALHQLPRLTAALRWVYVPISQYRASPRGYRVAVRTGTQAVTDIYLYQTSSGQEIVSWTGDSVFLDKKRLLFPFIDSLYQHTAAKPATVIDLR